MLTKPLSSTGIEIPEVGMGTWEYQAGTEPLLSGLEAGATFIDTAESYGNEEVVGRALTRWPGRVFVATKVSPHNFRRGDILKSADASLRRLGVDTIDLLQLHKPNRSIPIAETLGAMEDLVDAGKVRFIGVSNFSLPQLQEAERALRRNKIVSNQVRYNIADRTIEGGLLQYCQSQGITVIAYSPLGRELARVRDCDPTGVIDEVAQSIGKSYSQVVLNWCLSKDGVVVIPKGSSAAHVLDNCGASGWRLSDEHLRLLEDRVKHRRRGRLDAILRRAVPPGLRGMAVAVVRRLPRSLRQRIN